MPNDKFKFQQVSSFDTSKYTGGLFYNVSLNKTVYFCSIYVWKHVLCMYVFLVTINHVSLFIVFLATSSIFETQYIQGQKNIFLFYPAPGPKIISFSFFLSFFIDLSFSFIFISWRLITLQYCSGFCHTLTWISFSDVSLVLLLHQT